MGLEQTVTFASGSVPAWSTVADLLGRRGFIAQMRMIDGELAFPDEAPPEPWRELRVHTPQGMVTLRREAEQVRVVTWGNADAALLQAWNGLAWAFAEAGGGSVVTSAGARTASEFQREADLPAVLRS